MKTKLWKVGYAPITEMTREKTTYGEPVYFADAEAGGREYSATAKGESQTIYANSQLVYGGEENDGYEIKLTLIDIIDDIDEHWLGNTIATNGVLEKTSNKERPRFALILSDKDTDDVGKTVIFYNCQVTARPDISGKTAEEGKWDTQFPEYTIKASPRVSDGYVRFTTSGTDELTEVVEPTFDEAEPAQQSNTQQTDDPTD